jgi:sigma-B regulation protein RsbU (phosphoserine phosphatase)
MMMAAHEVLNALALTHPEPEELLLLANERLHELRDRGVAHRGGSFVALGYLGFSPDGGRLRYSLAGQPPPLLRRGTATVEELGMPEHRVPLGALGFGGHRVLDVQLGRDDLVLAYSDGVVEARAPGGEFFGSERLEQALLQCPHEPEAALRYLLEELEAFTRGHTPYDDLTMVAVRWVGG